MRRTSNMPRLEVIRQEILKAHLRPMISVVMPKAKAPRLEK